MFFHCTILNCIVELLILILFSDPNMAPQLAKPAPNFSGTAVINGTFKSIKLDDFKGKYLVLFFYPLDL